MGEKKREREREGENMQPESWAVFRPRTLRLQGKRLRPLSQQDVPHKLFNKIHKEGGTLNCGLNKLKKNEKINK